MRWVALAAPVGILTLLSCAAPASEAPAQPSPQPGYVVIDSFPHDPNAFTQGLDFDGPRLLETTGTPPASLRRVDLASGEVEKQVELPRRHFGEGMTVLGDRLWWITWRSEKAFVFDPVTFERRRSVDYTGEGWGLTNNRRRLIMSDGSDRLVFRNPRTFAITRSVRVTDDGVSVPSLNELEWVNGEIFANVWAGDMIARIDPANGEVVGWLDLSQLKAQEPEGNETNGIAYMAGSDRLFVTGKNWSHLYEIELVPTP